MTRFSEVHQGNEVGLSMETLNGALLQYGQLHVGNFPGMTFDKAAVSFMGQCPNAARCFATRQIPEADTYAIAMEVLNALAKERQLQTGQDYRSAFRVVCQENKELAEAYALSDPQGPNESELSLTEAGVALDKRAREIFLHADASEQRLTYKECFARALKEMPDAAEIYHGATISPASRG